jgi:hypothetical protein
MRSASMEDCALEACWTQRERTRRDEASLAQKGVAAMRFKTDWKKLRSIVGLGFCYFPRTDTYAVFLLFVTVSFWRKGNEYDVVNFPEMQAT